MTKTAKKPAAKKKPAEARPEIVLKFSEMSVIEIISLLNREGEMCDHIQKYYRYGKDLKLAFDVMFKIPMHRLEVDAALDGNDCDPPPAVIDAVMAFVNPGVSRQDVINKFDMCRSSFIGQPRRKNFDDYRKAIFDFCVRAAPAGVKIVE